MCLFKEKVFNYMKYETFLEYWHEDTASGIETEVYCYRHLLAAPSSQLAVTLSGHAWKPYSLCKAEMNEGCRCWDWWKAPSPSLSSHIYWNKKSAYTLWHHVPQSNAASCRLCTTQDGISLQNHCCISRQESHTADTVKNTETRDLFFPTLSTNVLSPLQQLLKPWTQAVNMLASSTLHGVVWFVKDAGFN